MPFNLAPLLNFLIKVRPNHLHIYFFFLPVVGIVDLVRSDRISSLCFSLVRGLLYYIQYKSKLLYTNKESPNHCAKLKTRDVFPFHNCIHFGFSFPPLKISKRQTRNLPGGSLVYPLIGEKLSFLRAQRGDRGSDWLEERISKHGLVFKNSLMGSPTVVIIGQAGNKLNCTWC